MVKKDIEADLAPPILSLPLTWTITSGCLQVLYKKWHLLLAKTAGNCIQQVDVIDKGPHPSINHSAIQNVVQV